MKNNCLLHNTHPSFMRPRIRMLLHKHRLPAFVKKKNISLGRDLAVFIRVPRVLVGRLHFAIILTISGNFCPYAVDISSWLRLNAASTQLRLRTNVSLLPVAWRSRRDSKYLLRRGKLWLFDFFLGALALVLGSFSPINSKTIPRASLWPSCASPSGASSPYHVW